ncbi:MAG TPA: hypothetical protein PLE74_07215 [Candidatus Cloacimonadota bacterium]|nr:hypothetical protein [Candidatus Cloacimonadota bacterium]HPT72055.1 hypothetical protein [Candidatus Cloacimonadota bacterium]
MDKEIKRANKQYRNRVILITLVILILGTIFIYYGFPYLEGILHNMEIEKSMKIAAYAIFVLFLIPLPFGFKCLSIANHILREQRYPPEDMKVLFDTEVIYGDKAKLRAYLFLLLAFMIFFICIFCAISAHIFLKILITQGV